MKRLTIFLAFSFIYGGLITPEDGATLNHIHVLFEWEQIPEADHYQIQITEDSDFSNLIVNTDDNTLAYIEKVALDWNSTYYWRTRPIYTSGVSGSPAQLLFHSLPCAHNQVCRLINDGYIHR